MLDPTVHPDLRQRGIGRELMRQAVAQAQERGIEWVHNGRIIRTVPVGVNPTALTVDEPTGNVLVTTIGATIDVPDPYRWGWLPGWVQERLSSLLPRTHHVHAVKPMVSVLDVTR